MRRVFRQRLVEGQRRDFLDFNILLQGAIKRIIHWKYDSIGKLGKACQRLFF